MSDSLDIVRTFTTIENNYITLEHTLLCYNDYLKDIDPFWERFCIHITFPVELHLAPFEIAGQLNCPL